MTHSIFLQNHFSFTHQLDVPFICWLCMVINFPITSKFPSIHDFNCKIGKFFKLTYAKKHSFKPTEFSITHTLPALLGFTTSPACDGRTFPTSTHNDSNVMSGHNVLSRHSVKHYEAMIINRFFISWNYIVQSNNK